MTGKHSSNKKIKKEKCGNIGKKKEKKQIKSKKKMNIDGNKTEKDKTEISEYEIIEGKQRVEK